MKNVIEVLEAVIDNRKRYLNTADMLTVFLEKTETERYIAELQQAINILKEHSK